VANKRPSFLKRQKEQARQARALEKREARQARKDAKASDDIASPEEVFELLNGPAVGTDDEEPTAR
jgi:hypothetical protein